MVSVFDVVIVALEEIKLVTATSFEMFAKGEIIVFRKYTPTPSAEMYAHFKGLRNKNPITSPCKNSETNMDSRYVVFHIDCP